ncbi:MAG: hypothetical protein AAFV53_36880 [Myxococcota bacterium]
MSGTRWGLMFTLCLMGCNGSNDDDNGPAIGDPALERIVLEVSYEPGAEPYTGPSPIGGDTWALFENNMAALFVGTGVTIENPNTLDEMGQIPEQDGQSFDVDRLLALDEAYRDTAATDSSRVYHAIWVDGYFADENGQNRGVIGVSIGNTGVIAMFKPVIESIGLTEGVRRFSEQTTLIHEVGHAVGLVNNGLEMQSAHQDEENGAHCDDDECVMFWANEGVGDIAEFVSRFITDGETVLFDDDCLSDVQSAFDQ